VEKAFEKYWETLDVDIYPEFMTKQDFRCLFCAGYRAAIRASRAKKQRK